MLGFFQGVPVPQALVGLVGVIDQVRLTEQDIGEDGGQVFQCHGGGQLQGIGGVLGNHIQQFGDNGLLGIHRQAGLHHLLVVVFMLAAVHGLLADKGPHRFLQFRVFDAVAIFAHAIDKEALAFREKQRQGVEELGYRGAPTVPVEYLFIRNMELQVPANWHDMHFHCYITFSPMVLLST